VVSSTPRPHFTPGTGPVPIVQEAAWAPGPVWTGGKSRLHRDSIPDRPARSSVAIPTELPGTRYPVRLTNYEADQYINTGYLNRNGEKTQMKQKHKTKYSLVVLTLSRLTTTIVAVPHR